MQKLVKAGNAIEQSIIFECLFLVEEGLAFIEFYGLVKIPFMMTLFEKYHSTPVAYDDLHDIGILMNRFRSNAVYEEDVFCSSYLEEDFEMYLSLMELDDKYVPEDLDMMYKLSDYPITPNGIV